MRRATAAVLASLVVAGCANTIDSESADRAAQADASTTTTVFEPQGTTVELLDQLLDEADALSEAIVESEGQHEIVARIDALWEAAKPGVEAGGSARVVVEFEQAIELLHNGVERRRPADADKGTNNLRTLTAAATISPRSGGRVTQDRHTGDPP